MQRFHRILTADVRFLFHRFVMLASFVFSGVII